MFRSRTGCFYWPLVALALLVAIALPTVAEAARTVIVRAGANGKSLALKPGDTLVVRLAANPSTGYDWAFVSRPKALRLIKSTYVTSPPGRVGQGGTFSFRLRAVTGRGTLKLAYRRPWEKGKAPAQSFSIKVRVRR